MFPSILSSAVLPKPKGNQNIVPSDSSFMDELIDIGSHGSVKFFEWSLNIITLSFVLGIIIMILAIIFKNGQWQKYGQLSMFWSFVSMLTLRAVPIMILSVRSEKDVDNGLAVILDSLSYVAIYVGLVGIAVSFLFRFGHTLIEHPEFHRWSKNARNVSIIMILFALVGPSIFALL